MIKKVAAVAAAAGGLVLASAGMAVAGEGVQGASGSSGVVAGNNVQLPVDVPVNLCGNTISVAGVMNPASGNACANG
ncbi:MAG TPA: chaplin [Streptomyces sp.]|nr:chaplin [Streptomyces sp.]